MFATDTLPAANSLSGASWFEMLETMQPGPELAAALDGLERDSLSGDELVGVMIAHRRLASHYAGEVYRDIAAVADAEYAAVSLDLDASSNQILSTSA